MSRNTTIDLPEELVARAEAYAAEHGTTLSALVTEHLTALTAGAADDVTTDTDPLAAYSRGTLPRGEAIRLLGLRDYASLLVALGDADLPMPLPPPHEQESQAALFAKLWGRDPDRSQDAAFTTGIDDAS